MRVLILQERGRHEKNREYREALCMQRSLLRAGHECTVWGLNYDNYSIPFEEIRKDHDVLLSLENYDTGWHPCIDSFEGLKVFWTIDSHCSLDMHLQHVKKSRYDLVLSSTQRYLNNYKNLVKYGVWFPNAYPADLIKPNPEVKRDNILGFCGSSIPQRDAIISSLSKNVYVKKDTFVIGDDMVNALSSYKIAFNYNIADDINYRTFEATAAGAMLLTNYTPNLEKLFDVGKEVVVYESIDDLAQKARYYSEHEEERSKIASAGMCRSSTDHSYDVRAKQFISIVSNI